MKRIANHRKCSNHRYPKQATPVDRCSAKAKTILTNTFWPASLAMALARVVRNAMKPVYIPASHYILVGSIKRKSRAWTNRPFPRNRRVRALFAFGVANAYRFGRNATVLLIVWAAKMSCNVCEIRQWTTNAMLRCISLQRSQNSIARRTYLFSCVISRSAIAEK